MRAQMITYFEERHGAGLSDVALKAVQLLATQAKAPRASWLRAVYSSHPPVRFPPLAGT